MNWKDIVRNIALPIVAMTVPGGAVLAPIVAASITAVEDLKSPGKDKRTAGRTIAQATAEGINAVRPGTVKVEEVVSAYDATVDAIVHAANVAVKPVDGPIPGVPLTPPS